jgi:hypothetical protein
MSVHGPALLVTHSDQPPSTRMLFLSFFGSERERERVNSDDAFFRNGQTPSADQSLAESSTNNQCNEKEMMLARPDQKLSQHQGQRPRNVGQEAHSDHHRQPEA